MYWPMVLFLFFLALPGIFIVLPRLIVLLLPDNSPQVQKKMTRLVVIQTLVMVMLMSVAGTVLSQRTGLGDPLLSALLGGGEAWRQIQDGLVAIGVLTVIGLLGFLLLYYGLAMRVLDQPTLLALQTFRNKIGLDGCILYGGGVDEILARWGLLNVILYFAMLFSGQKTNAMVWTAIVISGIFFTLGQLPAYLAAGCRASRQFVYCMLILCLWQALIFGYIFWHYGLLAAMFAHIVFYLGWYLYDRN
ncbi:hypothetical protein Lbir_1290 [Legionella birminghamensis]|uniref:CAAX amino terminal protease self- immunity n=1 Tax=Legionella birminghamensis TaxID=28083 RepID=A0ABR5QLF1_9GAMM|nr:hypothetical protein [Legionella birminghamensis]KTC72515.1 hypothetical protein Lbir_1290 [Legionella birminghamensis]